MSEADTCRKYITPALQGAGWENPPHDIREQEYFTAGRLLPIGDGEVAVRGERKFADYILYYQRDFKLAVVEAKEETLPAETGMQQAMEYAEILGLHFAYATNGKRIIEHDFTTGLETDIPRYPTPDELFARWRAAENLSDDAVARTTTRKSPSTAPSRPSCRATGASCSRWPQAPVKPSSPSRSPGNSGPPVGIAAVVSANPKSSSFPTAASW
jgi:type I site-specific restriction endonuclease